MSARYASKLIRCAGYFYFFKKNTKNEKDIQARLRIPRHLLERFAERCGRINTVNKPGLTVACQGGGWYEVFVVNDDRYRLVTEFLARLNGWVNQMQARSLDRLQAVVGQLSTNQHVISTNKFRYQITVPEPQPVAKSRLDALARTINSKYGH